MSWSAWSLFWICCHISLNVGLDRLVRAGTRCFVYKARRLGSGPLWSDRSLRIKTSRAIRWRGVLHAVISTLFVDVSIDVRAMPGGCMWSMQVLISMKSRVNLIRRVAFHDAEWVLQISGEYWMKPAPNLQACWEPSPAHGSAALKACQSASRIHQLWPLYSGREDPAE
jgi:hypothetical protein